MTLLNVLFHTMKLWQVHGWNHFMVRDFKPDVKKLYSYHKVSTNPWFQTMIYCTKSLYQTIKVISKLLRLPAIHRFKPWKQSISHGFQTTNMVCAQLYAQWNNKQHGEFLWGIPGEFYVRGMRLSSMSLAFDLCPLRPTSPVKIVTIDNVLFQTPYLHHWLRRIENQSSPPLLAKVNLPLLVGSVVNQLASRAKWK
jgi:hypothetical protein